MMTCRKATSAPSLSYTGFLVSTATPVSSFGHTNGVPRVVLQASGHFTPSTISLVRWKSRGDPVFLKGTRTSSVDVRLSASLGSDYTTLRADMGHTGAKPGDICTSHRDTCQPC